MNTQRLSHLLTNRHFIELEQFLNKPNLFSALRVQEHEIRHSKFLAYLLDPNETHGLGTAFISNFILWLSQKTGNDILIYDLDLDMAYIKAEWSGKDKESKDKLDIFINIPSKNNNEFQGFVVAIECKINSTQSDGQLEKYSKLLKDNGFESATCIFLTVFGEDCGDANCKKWISLTYTDLVLNALETTIISHGKLISEKISYVLDDYKETILELADEKRVEEIDNLCESLLIYKDVINDSRYSEFLKIKHRRATEKLKKFFDGKRNRLKKSFEYFCKENKSKITYATSNSAYLRFYPSMRELYPLTVDKSLTVDRGGQVAYRWVEDGFPLLFEVFLQDREASVTLRLNLVFGPLADDFNKERTNLIANIKNIDPLPNKWKSHSRNNVTNTFTRVCGYTELITVSDVSHFKNILDVLHVAATALAKTIDPVLRSSFLAKKADSSL